MRTDIHGITHNATPSGYGPSDLQTAYGLTKYSQNNGSVDRTSNPNEKTHTFAGGYQDGYEPIGGVITDGASALYGATVEGGPLATEPCSR